MIYSDSIFWKFKYIHIVIKCSYLKQPLLILFINLTSLQTQHHCCGFDSQLGHDYI